MFFRLYVLYKTIARHFRKDKIEFIVYKSNDGYIVHALAGNFSVYDNYGSTPEMAKEMARLRVKQYREDGEKQ
jgi:hypothetical protein